MPGDLRAHRGRHARAGGLGPSRHAGVLREARPEAAGAVDVRDDDAEELLKVLRARFGELPDAATARIHAADSAQLDAWFDRVLAAVSLDDVLDSI